MSSINSTSPTSTAPTVSTPTAPTTSVPPPPPPTTTTTTTPSSSSPPPPPPTTTSPPSSSPPPASSTPPTTQTTIVTETITGSNGPTTRSSTMGPSSTTPGTVGGGGNGGGGLTDSGRIAIGVVVPLVAIAALAVLGLFLWRKRRARKDAEEERRKEVEDYIYNPNADPTIPDVGNAGYGAGAAGTAAGAGAAMYETREDGAGYRGWGTTTLAGSTGRKTSTTMSGGAGGAYSDTTSPTHNISDARSGEALLDGRAISPEGEVLGAMGPSAANNRGNGVQRGPSNASSQYSVGGRSEASVEMPPPPGIGVAYGGGNGYYDQYGAQNPYVDGPQRTNTVNHGNVGELPGQPVIRDNPARRNTRIENSGHWPQQSAGISQNF